MQQILAEMDVVFLTLCNILRILPSGLIHLGPSINGLVTDENTKLWCRGFVLALFQSTTAYKIDSEHTIDYTKLFRVYKVEILQDTVKKI